MSSRVKMSLMIAVAFAIGCADAPTAPPMTDELATPSLQTHDDSSCSGGGGEEDDGCGGGEDDGCSGGGGGGGGGGSGGGCGGGDVDGPHFSPRWTVCTPSAALVPVDASDVACTFRFAGLGPYDELDMRLEARFAVDYVCVNPGGKTLPRMQQFTTTAKDLVSFADFAGRIDGAVSVVPDESTLRCPNQKVEWRTPKWGVDILRSVVLGYQLSATVDDTIVVIFTEQQHGGGDDGGCGDDHEGDDCEGGGTN